MSYLTPPGALALFEGLTHNAQIPLDYREITRARRYQPHDYVLLGDTPARRFKHGGRWRYLEQDIRRAGQALARLVFDPHDVVTVRLHEASPASRPDWRGWIGSHLYTLPTRPGQVGPSRTPDWTALRSSTWSLAGTFPLRLLTHAGGQWLLPRAFVELMDRWQERENELIAQAQLCKDCGTQGPGGYEWRTLEGTGYVTRCPDCSRDRLPHYSDQLAGRTYQWAKESSHRAADYLCRLCGTRRAYVWDHCHQPTHQYVRGPLCASCNTAEGRGPEAAFLQRDGAARYLLHCPGCRSERSLPDQHYAAVAGAHLAQTEQRCPLLCTAPPTVRPMPDADLPGGALHYTLTCSRHPWEGTWTASVPAAQARAIVAEFVDSQLAAGR
ncbi:endonuclease domain-containing protein [Streptomyces europaeiscabiei]|uniref:endonuclease domain-containing protein n=1 Tax=Streptomyces europaeiscabiei TaxID=146819 RepID=UPI0029B1A8A7|nr:endonuclease domain-containing protein [Streptomyces europaeiscabiei]MDX3695029.1 endonuclease domain-containing protein [Streptomyces europaeiscabiei]